MLQVGTGGGEASTARESTTPATTGTWEEHDLQRPHHHMTHQQLATAANFHISRPSHSISTILSPPPLHHTTSIILDEDSFHVSRMMLQNENFQVYIRTFNQPNLLIYHYWENSLSYFLILTFFFLFQMFRFAQETLA